MGLFPKFPYTNFHELNLDWIVEQTKKNTEAIKQLSEVEALKDAFVINIQVWMSPFSADVSYSDLKAAVNAGKRIIAVIQTSSIPAAYELSGDISWDFILPMNEHVKFSLPPIITYDSGDNELDITCDRYVKIVPGDTVTYNTVDKSVAL